MNKFAGAPPKTGRAATQLAPLALTRVVKVARRSDMGQLGTGLASESWTQSTGRVDIPPFLVASALASRLNLRPPACG